MAYNGPIRTLADIKHLHESTGGHWFSLDSMEFFSSLVSETVYPVPTGALFVSSEQFDATTPRRWSIRFIDKTTGRIGTIGEFQQYPSSKSAHRAARTLQARHRGLSAITAQHTVQTAVGGAQHALRGGIEWSYTGGNRTECGRTANAVNSTMSGALLHITCATCRRIRGGTDDYRIEVTKRYVSYYAEACPEKGQDGHECECACTWLEGDSREVRSPDESVITPDTYDIDMHDGVVLDWALEYIRMHTTVTEASFSPIGDAVREHDWLSGSYDHPYRDEVEETTVRLTGDWTDQERAVIFKRVTQAALKSFGRL